MTGLLNVITAVAAFSISAIMGYILIPKLRKIKFGQTIKEIGPKWHMDKQGTPTMGGFLFIAGVIIASLAGYFIYIMYEDSYPIDMYVNSVKFFAGLGLGLAFGFVGFVDDYIKVVKKQNLGLKARYKTVMQIVISVSYIMTLVLAGASTTVIVIPFVGQFDLGMLYYPLAIIIIIGAVNAVNLTDGIDGLAGSITFIVGISFIIISSILEYSFMGILSAALAAACLGFLLWNFYPARVFMGDTGSMFLGGIVVAIAFGIDLPIILVLLGIVYIVETLSVIMQVISFKLTGKRIFKMSPIHHHFEMIGWSESKIVVIFSLITVVFCVIGIYSVVQM